jgi:tetratricopeptide (TPR) repeat protein
MAAFARLNQCSAKIRGVSDQIQGEARILTMDSPKKYRPGDRVVAIRAAAIQDEGRTVASVAPGSDLTVEGVSGDAIRVAFGQSGWLPADAVVLEGQAIEYFNRLLRLDTTNVELLAAKAAVRLALKEWDKAIEEYTRLILGDRSAADFLVKRGFARLNKADLDGAIEDLSAAIELDRRNALAFHFRGNGWQLKGDYKRAIVDFNKAIKLDRPSGFSYGLRGYCWHRLGDYDKAVVDFTEAILRQPRYASLFTCRGTSWHALGNRKRALTDLTTAIFLDPKDVVAFYNRGLTSFQMGSYDQAVVDYNKAIALDPEHSLAHNNLAWLYATCADDSLRNAEQAMSHAHSACKLSEWTVGLCLGTLAAAYAEAGRFGEAVVWQTKADVLYSEEERREWGFLLDLYKQQQCFRVQRTQ